MDVTLEDLREFQSMQEEMKSIKAEIQSLYYPVSSPSGSLVIAGRSSVRPAGDPTASTVRDIEERRNKLERMQAEREELADRIYTFVDSMDDRHIAAIVRYHFLLGLTWAQTAKQIYGYADADICRNAVKRYFKKR